MKFNQLLLILSITLLLMACSSDEPVYLYPSAKTQQLREVCGGVYKQRESVHHDTYKKSRLDLLVIHETHVTYHFENQRSYSFPKAEHITLPQGMYRCE